jgi:signal transduction histidine kinase
MTVGGRTTDLREDRRSAAERGVRRILAMVAQDAPVDALVSAIAREAADVLGVGQVAIHRSPGEGSGLCVPIRVGAAVWGTICAEAGQGPLADDAEELLVQFAHLTAMVVGGRVVLGGIRLLAREQSIAGTLAKLIADGAPTGDVFEAIAVEIAGGLGVAEVAIARYEPGGTVAVVGSPGPVCPTGTVWHGPPQLDSGVSVPIMMGGAVWGLVGIPAADGEALRPDAEKRLDELADVVSSAIANLATRDDLRRLARERAALRAVATLIAEQAPPQAVFDAVATEASQALDLARIGVYRYDPDRCVTVLATTPHPTLGPGGTRWPLDGPSVLATILRTGRPTRIDNFDESVGAIASHHRAQGFGGAAGAPIEIDGSLWGAVVAVATTPEAFPAGTEQRMAAFTQLLATAIANVQARSHLAASRARIVAAADAERRRVVGDLQHGAQRRLAHTMARTKLARRALAQGRPDAMALIDEALQYAETATDELRALAHGILPAALAQGGLAAGVTLLASRITMPIDIEISVDRLPDLVEATAYAVVAEALTNVARHEHVHHATVRAVLAGHRLEVSVRDDGVGDAGADRSALLGLSDRLAALEGSLRVEGDAAGGTVIAASIPVPPGDPGRTRGIGQPSRA